MRKGRFPRVALHFRVRASAGIAQMLKVAKSMIIANTTFGAGTAAIVLPPASQSMSARVKVDAGGSTEKTQASSSGQISTSWRGL